jgi:hypothetical protein
MTASAPPDAVKRFSRFADVISSRNWFLTVYALIALVVGLVNVWLIDMLGFSAQQLFISSVPVMLTEGTFFTTARPLVSLGIHICGAAPFILIFFAIIRGRRIGNRGLAIFPILGLVVMLLGALPFMLANVDGDVVIFAPSILAWMLDVACLRRGARESTVARSMNHPKA